MNLSFYGDLKSIAFFWSLLISCQTLVWAQPPPPQQQQGWILSQKIGSGDLVSVYFTSENDGWIAGDGGYLARTADGGRTWIKQNINTRENINEIYFRGDDNGYILAGNKIFISKDKGATWRETLIIELSELKGLTPEFLSVRFVNRRRGYIVGSVANRNEVVVDSLVLQTNDGGESWRRIPVPTKAELFHLDFVGDDYGWIVGDGGVIIATTDGGGSWQTQISGTDRALRNVDFRDKDNGHAVGGRGVILRTEDGGRTWRKATTAYAESFFRVIFPDDKNGFIVGRGGVILRTDDRGRSWVKMDGKTSEPLYGLFMAKKYGWAVGGSGVVLRYQR
jgi:photosystem II stability/assembly factor-like uncharacterized protein